MNGAPRSVIEEDEWATRHVWTNGLRDQFIDSAIEVAS